MGGYPRAFDYLTVRGVHEKQVSLTEGTFFMEVITVQATPAGSLLEYLQQIPDPRGR
jgi:hypothetical protein